jgi:hypothetical protein
LNVAVHDLKKRQNEMPISEKMKAAQEMKNLQVELKTIQEERQTTLAQYEPLQEKAEKMIT